MSRPAQELTFVRDVGSSLGNVWKSLLGTALLYKAIAVTILTPVFTGAWHLVLALSGDAVLSDAQIAGFFLGPFGWLCGLLMAAIWLVIEAMEQATLLYVIASKSEGATAKSISAIRFALRNAREIFSVAVCLVAFTIACILPILLLGAAAFRLLLGEFDINYYLSAKPAEFLVAIGFGTVLALSLFLLLVWLFSGWFLALPLALFEDKRGRDALFESRRRIGSHRRRVVWWILGWAGVVLLSQLIVSAVVGALGQVLIPHQATSIFSIAVRVGVFALLIAASSLAVNLFASMTLAGVMFHGLKVLDAGSSHRIAAKVSQEDARTKSRLNVVTLPRVIASTVILALLAVTTGYILLESIRPRDAVQIMAHRGASYAAPENTLAAFRKAIEDGADWIELDVQETADGEVVVAHDSDLMKAANHRLKIWDATMEDLADIDIGSWFDAKYSNERVPTLREVLRLCRDRIGVIIELKYYGHDVNLEQRVVEIVEAEGMADQILVMSLKPAGIAKLKSIRPSWKCGLLLSVYVGDLKKIDADFLAINARFGTRQFVDRAEKLGKDVFVWTVNDAATMSQMLNRRVDGILTDRPDLARRVIDEREELNSAERLLAEVSVLFQPAKDTPQ
ncbi:MAG: glycerophosphodiester phosphodiesterase [Planctomycetota bacterium]